MKSMVNGQWSHAEVRRGVSLIDAVVGTALMLLVFLGIFGSFQLAIQVIGNSKAKVGAVALANERLEFVRSLSYDAVGTAGGIPSGSIVQTESVTLNNIAYERRTFIAFVDAPADGSGGDDENGITADYKTVKVEVSWTLKGNSRSIAMTTNVVPRGIETLAGGGTLMIDVINALGQSVIGATVRIVNASTTPAIDVTTYSNTAGRVVFPGSPAAASYEVTVSKLNMSTAQTYDTTGANPNPNPGHLTVVQGAVTSATFAIDDLAAGVVRTFDPIATLMWDDDFDDGTRLAVLANAMLSAGDIVLSGDPDIGYAPSGSAESVEFAPQYLITWDELAFMHTLPPSTSFFARILYENGGSWTPIPDIDLPGNVAGFSTSPVDIGSVDAATYPRLRIYGGLSTADASSTPALENWELAYTAGPFPKPNIPFSITGAKIIGSTGVGDPIYKYNESKTTDAAGQIVLSLEFDTYDISIDEGALDLNIISACPFQPFSIDPGQTLVVDLILDGPASVHSLLGSVINTASGNPIEGATVRVHRDLPVYDETALTDSCGQVFFENMPSGIVENGDAFTADITHALYMPFQETDIEVQGASRFSSELNQL